ncbi:MAG: DUF72 domain-containing protein [Chthoniobacteraceae bacterium]
MKTYIGTSGFQYPEWKGAFYPEKMPVGKMLPYYAERFSSTESNYSFRTIPSRKTIDDWHAATPAEFRFSFKALQQITHFARLKNCVEKVRAFSDGIAPMGAKLGIVLFQLPPNFSRDTALLRTFLGELPQGMRASFEFRHKSWFEEEVFTCLRDHGAALCIAEDEKLATPPIATAPFGYLRLRRLDYTPADLKRWARFVADQADWQEAFVYFKHEETGVGPKFAQKFQKLISGA